MAEALLEFLGELVVSTLGEVVFELLWRARWLLLALLCVAAALVAGLYLLP